MKLYGSRKIIANGVALAIGVGAVALKGDIPPGFLTLLQTVLGAFTLGNIGEHMSTAYTRVNGQIEGEGTTTDLAPIIEAIKTSTAMTNEGLQLVGGGVLNVQNMLLKAIPPHVLNAESPKQL